MELPPSNWSLSFLLLLLELPKVLAGSSQIPLNGTVGQSVLLPFRFIFNSSVPDPLAIRWYFNENEILGSLTVKNCSLSCVWENPTHCCNKSFTQGPRHQGRVELSPETLSVLLHNLTLNDSGVYKVAFNGACEFEVIELLVTAPASMPGSAATKPPRNTGSNALTLGLIVGICCIFIILILLLFLLGCQSHRVCAKLAMETKTIKQRKEPGPKELRLENLPPGPDAIYETIREDQMKYHPAPDQLTLYSTIQLPVEY
ncbi:uncharacterized protein LOC119929970 [Tachyglossus aculeatus]|uniref:uncharacterized protein LOC119929970 n=1 Tax=Tachyglossus aculeatus TaxID=9261 RepID=UPI0018F6C8DE|nr:uncharacterized protein LOC119929970 [Tachyglossus aculeatus]